MILLDQAAGTTRTPDADQKTHRGNATVIILERDGSLRHYPPDRPGGGRRSAQIEINEEQAQPKMLERLLDLTFDVLGLSSLEVRINEHPKR